VLLNTRHMSELIEKGEINEIKEAMEKSMAPGSQTFEQSLFKLFVAGDITQDEAMVNADSATNMLWLINQATAGHITSGQVSIPAVPPAGQEKKEGLLGGGGNAQFDGIKIDMTS
jgi:twitching motility protein PilU